jgi:hypothetical protein
MSVWVDSVFSVDDGYMQTSFRLAAQMMEAGEDYDAQVDYIVRMRLPATTVPAGGKKSWDMGGFKLRTRMNPASTEQESSVILSLINEIRQKMAINIDAAPAFNKKVPAEDEVRTAGGKRCIWQWEVTMLGT